jgi:hypothetical protein
LGVEACRLSARPISRKRRWTLPQKLCKRILGRLDSYARGAPSRTWRNEVLSLDDLPLPKRKKGEVLIRMAAGGLHRVDFYLRNSGAGITYVACSPLTGPRCMHFISRP